MPAGGQEATGPAAPFEGELVELALEQRPVGEPVQQDGVARRVLQPLGQRPQRRQADAGADAGPALAVQEPPGEELAGLHRQPVQVAAGQVHRDDPGGLGHDRGDMQPVPGVAPQREADPPHQDGSGGQRPQAPPEDGGRGRGEELLPGPQLVGQRQPDAEVGVQVQQVPGLVAEPPAGGPEAGGHRHDHAGGAGQGQQHARVVGDQVPERRRGRAELAGRVSPGDEHDVDHHQVERGEADHPVVAGQLVLAERPLKLRHSEAAGRDGRMGRGRTVAVVAWFTGSSCRRRSVGSRPA